MALIYKIFREDEFLAFQNAGVSDGAPVDLADGYIHFSTADQVVETASKHFAGATGLQLLALDADALSADLKWEPSRGGAFFPHLYRALRSDDVLWAKPIPVRAGIHDFQDLIDP